MTKQQKQQIFVRGELRSFQQTGTGPSMTINMTMADIAALKEQLNQKFPSIKVNTTDKWIEVIEPSYTVTRTMQFTCYTDDNIQYGKSWARFETDRTSVGQWHTAGYKVRDLNPTFVEPKWIELTYYGDYLKPTAQITAHQSDNLQGTDHDGSGWIPALPDSRQTAGQFIKDGFRVRDLNPEYKGA